jgi:hypothetical protein
MAQRTRRARPTLSAEIFERAQKFAPAVILFDEIDSIAPSRSAESAQHQVSVVAQLLVLLDGIEGALATANPTGSRGARHTEVMEQFWVTLFADDVSKSVVIRLTAGRGWHASRLIAPGSRGKPAEEQFPPRFHPCCICDAVTPGCPGS